MTAGEVFFKMSVRKVYDKSGSQKRKEKKERERKETEGRQPISFHRKVSPTSNNMVYYDWVTLAVPHLCVADSQLSDVVAKSLIHR